jgi:hypothetical protein
LKANENKAIKVSTNNFNIISTQTIVSFNEKDYCFDTSNQILQRFNFLAKLETERFEDVLVR